HRFDRKPDSKRLENLQHCCEFRISVAAKRTIKAFSGEPGFARDLSHAARSSSHTESMADERGIAIFKDGVHVGGNFFFAVEVLCGVIARCFNCHGDYSYNSLAIAFARFMSLS